MQRLGIWSELNWRHPVREVVRYYRALRGGKKKQAFLDELLNEKTLSLDNKTLPIQDDVVDLLFQYLSIENELFVTAENALRSEEAALSYCETQGFTVGNTKTKNTDHHQSSKSMISSVTGIAHAVCEARDITFDLDPPE